MKKIILFSILLALTANGDDFAFKLYNQLCTTPGNLFFSPASIEAALSMTREGAASNTLRQMSMLLPETVTFPKTGTNVTLESANTLWVDKKFPILGRFQTTVQEKYSAEIRPADFAGQPDAERATINRWVEKKTRDKIKNLLASGSVTSDTRMILVNAIYFKGKWLHEFEKESTTDELFWMTPDISTNAPMMTMKTERFGYMENESFQCLELPYQSEEISMLIVLPKEKADLTRIEEGLSANAIASWIDALREDEVKVYLPRFKVESQFDSMTKPLAELGMMDAFNPLLADFSRISTERLYISDVVHKAFVQVDEEGTEAAAATGVIMRMTSAPLSPKVFRADHPFLFLIRHNASGTILFIGRVSSPAN